MIYPTPTATLDGATPVLVLKRIDQWRYVLTLQGDLQWVLLSRLHYCGEHCHMTAETLAQLASLKEEWLASAQ